MAHDIVVDETGSQVNLPFAFRLGLVGTWAMKSDERRGLPRRNVRKSAGARRRVHKMGRAVVIQDNVCGSSSYNVAQSMMMVAPRPSRRPSSKAYTKKFVSVRFPKTLSKRAYAKRVARPRHRRRRLLRGVSDDDLWRGVGSRGRPPDVVRSFTVKIRRRMPYQTR